MSHNFPCGPQGGKLSQLTLASFPGLPRFLFFGLRSVEYTEAEEREKRGRPGNTYHVNDVRWTRGGRRGGGARLQVRAQ